MVNYKEGLLDRASQHQALLKATEILEREEDTEVAIEQLFDEFVPQEGAAATIGGEVIRAICRLNYRWNNDGDVIGIGYGIETVSPAWCFIKAVMSYFNDGYDFTKAYIEDELYEEYVVDLWSRFYPTSSSISHGSQEGKAYDKLIQDLNKEVMDFLRKNPNLFTKPLKSFGYSMFDFKPKFEFGYSEQDICDECGCDPDSLDLDEYERFQEILYDYMNGGNLISVDDYQSCVDDVNDFLASLE